MERERETRGDVRFVVGVRVGVAGLVLLMGCGGLMGEIDL